MSRRGAPQTVNPWWDIGGMQINLRASLWAVNLLLVAIAGYAASVTTAMLLEKYLVVNTPRVEIARGNTNAVTARKKLPLKAFDSIAEANIFRARRRTVALLAPTPQATASAPVQAVVNQPAASGATLNLTLTGTFVAHPVAFAFVTSSSSPKEAVYAVGDCLPQVGDAPTSECNPNQGKLKSVAQDRIVVTYAGRDTVYELTRNTVRSARAPARPTAAPSRNRGKRALGARAATARAARAQPSGDQFPSTQNGNDIEFRVPGTEVESAFDNFSDILKQARVIPYSVNGKPQGFKILRIRAGSIFARLGLKNNDIIQQVNGEPLSSADQALGLFTLFKNEREVVLNIERNKTELSLTYIIE